MLVFCCCRLQSWKIADRVQLEVFLQLQSGLGGKWTQRHEMVEIDWLTQAAECLKHS